MRWRIAFVLLVIICFGLALISPETGWSKTKLPPHWKQWVKTCRAEQPGSGWKGIAWRHDGSGVTYPGGCGFTILNWEEHKPKSAPSRMSEATPAQQLWACERIYRFYLNQSGSHRYAATVWDANRSVLGWYGFTKETW